MSSYFKTSYKVFLILLRINNLKRKCSDKVYLNSDCYAKRRTSPNHHLFNGKPLSFILFKRLLFVVATE